MSAVASHFRDQAYWCGEFGSRFTCLLLLKAADDLEAGGMVSRLVGDWPTSPRVDALSLRLAGALHAAALTGSDAALAAAYPAADANWSMERIWPLALGFMEREEGWVRAFLSSPPQTNETGRATGLASAFMWLAGRAPQPFYMLELGASAGLNMNWDRFGYAYEPWGRTDLEPVILTRVSGDLPAWRDIEIASRAACDQNPIDVRDEAERQRLRAYIWADQPERLHRLERAMSVAVQTGAQVAKADAAEWIATQLHGGLKPGLTVVYHSLFLQYPPRDTRRLIVETIERVGEAAMAERQLAWVRLEPERDTAGAVPARYVVSVAHWNGQGREERTLAEADPHGRFLTWIS
jgi:hypothetical protein